MGKFPVLLSIPHGGNKTPAEIRDKLCITEHDIFWDIDPFTHDIYDLNNHVIEVIKTNIARTFVDVNRSTSQMPPRIPDGLIKSVTSFKKPIYCKGMFPDRGLISTLIKKYYEPYQKKIETALQCKEIRLGLDCHSMLAEGPPIARDRGKRRPLICLGNGRGKTSSNELIELLAKCFARGFRIKLEDIKINIPFSGGFITRTYGNKSVPWVQIEISRELYLEGSWFDSEKLSVSSDRLSELRSKFQRSLVFFFESGMI